MMRKDKYHQKSEEPLYWFNKASDLRGTAGLIWIGMKSENFDEIAEKLGFGKGFNFGFACWKPYHMICGLALELAFKAIIVSHRKNVPSSHNLNELAVLAELDYSEEDLELMRILSSFIVWSGKYPIPKSSVEMENHYDLIDKHFFKVTKQVGDLQFKQQHKSFDWDSFSSLWAKASDTFFALNGR